MKTSFALFICLILFSCSGDDNNGESFDENLLVGKWKQESIVTENNIYLELSDCDTGLYTEFKADNSFKDIYLCGAVEYIDNYTYTINGNILTTTFIGDPGQDEPINSYTILRLNSVELITKFTYNDEDGNSHTNTITYYKYTN